MSTTCTTTFVTKRFSTSSTRYLGWLEQHSEVTLVDEQVETLDGVVMDARIGRQWHELLEMPEVDPGPDDAVVIHLGNNGAVTTDTLDAVLERFADAGRVVLVTVRVPRPWESQVNRALSGATGRYPNTVLADWQGASDGTPNWFGGDGVHLTQSGAKALRDTIAYALRVD